MAVVPRSPGTRGTNTVAVSPGTAAGDMVLLFVSGNATTGGTSPSSANFSLAGIGYQAGTSGRYTAILVKKATGADTGTYSVTAPSGGTIVTSEVIAFSGVDISGAGYSLLQATGATPLANTTVSVSGTASAGDYLIESVATSGTSLTITPLTGWGEIGSTVSSIMHTVGRIWTGGATGPLVMNMSANSTNRTAILISLPAAAAPPANNSNFLGFF